MPRNAVTNYLQRGSRLIANEDCDHHIWQSKDHQNSFYFWLINVSIYFKTETHEIQPGFILTVQSRMTLNFGSSSTP